ncbi:hypothetical protein F9C07_5120 [Aspergillus flavus]|uniref:Uncharacterized protein n=1 Tax=Aspergillus flavus (strain ATCC 200026 / FGSC A1120 / IAM 13836 / NRRL 3357 / JCM 12722 / SRRC 167) TaxID=332952 RepID=A0A7U2MLW8_ASPFN|nr:hypothetical protein F9C07_5120 [Aspergillus flavus]
MVSNFCLLARYLYRKGLAKDIREDNVYPVEDEPTILTCIFLSHKQNPGKEIRRARLKKTLNEMK